MQWPGVFRRIRLDLAGVTGASFIACVGLAACQSRPLIQLPYAAEDLVSTPARAQALPDMALISETDFQRLLEAGDVQPATPASRLAAIDFTAAANSPAALGVLGRLESPASVKGDLFVVARDAALTSDGRVQAKSYFVVSASLAGRVSWVAPALSLLSVESVAGASHGLQGCAPLAGREGVPDGIVLNLESSSRPVNASGESIEVQWPSATTSGVWNRLQCSGEVRIATDVARPPPMPEPLEFESTTPFPSGAVVISESEFSRLAKSQVATKISEDSKLAAARLVTAAADPLAMGIEAQFDPESNLQFSTSFLVVVRDPVVSGDTLNAHEFFVVPMDFSGTAGWVGRNPKLGFSGDPHNFDLDDAFCGPRITLRREPDCDAGFCVGGDHPWMGSGLGMGGPATGTFAPTIRLFGFNKGGLDLRDITAIACTGRLAPPEREAYECGVPGGGLGPERCNGRDDDCNHQTDEGGVCDQVPMRCPAQPRSCGAVTCGDLPDGCGGTLHCGAPCT